MSQSRAMRVLASLCVGASALNAGCLAIVAGAAAAAGTYVYTEGRLESVEQAPVASVYEATLLAMADLEYRVVEKQKDALEARVVAEKADETEVKIALAHKTDKSTEVRIRVGITGDRKLSAIILEKIRGRLPAS